MEQARKGETEKKGGLTRMTRRLAGIDELSRGKTAISELFSAIDPRKYAPSRRGIVTGKQIGRAHV